MQYKNQVHMVIPWLLWEMNIIVHMTVRTRYSHEYFEQNCFVIINNTKDNFSIEELKTL